jgi:hypothetical protein
LREGCPSCPRTWARFIRAVQHYHTGRSDGWSDRQSCGISIIYPGSS